MLPMTLGKRVGSTFFYKYFLRSELTSGLGKKAVGCGLFFRRPAHLRRGLGVVTVELAVRLCGLNDLPSR